MTKFRFGLIVGFATGYYLGTQAGRERYLQINRAVARLRRSDGITTAIGKARAVLDLSRERARAHETEPFTQPTAPVFSTN